MSLNRLAALSYISCVLVVAFTMPAQVRAHNVGASFNATTSPYVIDVGYDTIPFTAGQSVRFDFVLRDEKTGATVPFDQVWVRITSAQDTQLATGLFHQPFGPTTLLYVFAAGGTYKIEPSFRSADGTEIAVASFPITVDENAATSSPVQKYALNVILFMCGAAVGYGAVRYVWLSKRS